MLNRLVALSRPHSGALAADRGHESATNRSAVLELGLGKSQTDFQNLVQKSQNPPDPGPQRWPAAGPSHASAEATHDRYDDCADMSRKTLGVVGNRLRTIYLCPNMPGIAWN